MLRLEKQLAWPFLAIAETILGYQFRTGSRPVRHMAPDATKVHLSDRGFPEPVVAVARRLRGALDTNPLSGSDPVPEHSNACGGIVLGSALIAAYSARLKA